MVCDILFGRGEMQIVCTQEYLEYLLETGRAVAAIAYTDNGAVVYAP